MYFAQDLLAEKCSSIEDKSRKFQIWNQGIRTEDHKTARSKITHKGACDQIKSYGEQWNSESADKTYEVIYTTEMENSWSGIL